MKSQSIPVPMVVLLAVVLPGCHSQAHEESSAAAAPPAPVVVTPELLERGHASYKLNCVPCHGESGRGDGPSSANLDPKPRDHTSAAYMTTLTDDDIRKIVNFGGAIKGMPQMPSSPHIQGEEMAALIAFVRSLSATQAANP
jgi:mono/diheme cytochrome c family protein